MIGNSLQRSRYSSSSIFHCARIETVMEKEIYIYTPGDAWARAQYTRTRRGWLSFSSIRTFEAGRRAVFFLDRHFQTGFVFVYII